MSESSTLQSRLRVLVAKTYRAEKLFSSIRNTAEPKILSHSSLSDLANDIRAKEWQIAHNELRSRLNDMLNPQVGSSPLSGQVQLLFNEFHEAYDADRAELLQGIEAVQETAEREEFAQSLRFSLDLIRLKARAQVRKAITDELASVLQISTNTALKAALEQNASSADRHDDETPEAELANESGEATSNSRRKVIELRPRAYATGR